MIRHQPIYPRLVARYDPFTIRTGKIMLVKEKEMTRTHLAGVVLLVTVGCLAWSMPPANPSADTAPDGWTTAAPREEIRPTFVYEPKGGPDGKGAFVIRTDRHDGLDGWWTKTFPVTGGKHYRFQAL